MTQRTPYLIAYDVVNPARLRRVRQIVRGYAVGGQKSAYECLLTPAERESLVQQLTQITEPAEDSVYLIRLLRHQSSWVLGLAKPVPPDSFSYVG